MSRTAALVAAVALLVGSPPAAAAPARSELHRHQSHRYAVQAFRATNDARADHGLGPLRAEDCLRRAAARQAQRMAAQRRIFHQDLYAVLDACGEDQAGENVAVGFATGVTVVDDGWMESAGHRRNILHPGYRLMGIGAALGEDGRWYVAQVLGRQR